MAAKIITVVGATGAQGKGVVSAFLNNPAYQVRAITRNPSSAAGQALAAQGAEVVSADLNDVSSLERAFAGSHTIYAVTNFFEPFISHQDPQKAMQVEIQQGINLARAAVSTLSTLKHYIWSTLPNAKEISEGKYLIPHFEGKNRIDAYIRDEQPELLKKTTFFWVTWYHSNYTFPMFTPYWIPTAEKYVQIGNYRGDTPIVTIGDVSVNVGKFVKGVVERREEGGNGQIVLAAIEGVRQAEEMLQAWAKAKGTKAQFLQVDGKAFRLVWPLWAEEMGVMMEFWDEYRERSWTDASGREVVAGRELGVEGLQSLEAAYEGLEL